MATVELKESEWKAFSKSEYAVIDCYGDYCAACVILEPIYDAVADEMPEIAFGRINISHYPEIAEEYGITAMPTLLYFRNGELINQSIGSVDREELLRLISELLYS